MTPLTNLVSCFAEANGSTDCPLTLPIPNGGVIEDATEPPPAASIVSQHRLPSVLIGEMVRNQ